jgi:hypothetical protein
VLKFPSIEHRPQLCYSGSGDPEGSMATISVSESQESLIAEIPSAMRKKLEHDGLAKGVMTANTLIALSLALEQLMIHSEFSYRFMVSFFGVGVGVIALAVLPLYLKKRSVLAEVRYRRQHGNWRWEH